jgi:ribosomal peptide maturation radical SAM protein 1
MGGHAVLLVAMPWHVLELPSIQLGILQSVLDRERIRTGSRTFTLAFMEHCRRATAGRPAAEVIGLADYDAVAHNYYRLGLGDWIFAVPPFRDAADLDEEYRAYLRRMEVPEEQIRKAQTMRSLVPAFLRQCAADILAAAPRVVGFTTTHSQRVPCLVLAKMVKARNPCLAIVFGGGHCEGPMGAALHRAFPWVDVVVRGEAERVLPGLVKDVLAGGPIRPQPGLCYREGDRTVAVHPSGAGTLPMDELPTPAYDEYFDRLAKTSFAAELAGGAGVAYETARGCWWGAKSPCGFCGLNGTRMGFRSKSPARVLHEVPALAARHGRLDFQVVDNIFDPRYLRDVFPRLREARYDLGLFYETKANLTRQQVRLLREAGVQWIQAGLESLSTPILRRMRKGQTAFQNIRFLKWCARDGIQVSWNVIYGIPGEPAGEYARMADLAPSLAHLQAPALCPLVLDRFSPYHERPEAWGLEVLGPLPHDRLIYPTDEETLADLAYTFEYRHADGRDPEAYVIPLRRAIERWQANGPAGYRALRYRRGPGFLVIRDRRPGLEAADYTFDDHEARIYLACEDGATAEGARAALGPAAAPEIHVDYIREFLDELVTLRLVYEEGGRYLALALPAGLPEHR